METLFRQGLASMGLWLPDDVVGEELLYLDELLRWNKKINLTSIRNKDSALEKHLLDSLTLLKHVKRGESFLDVGSGGGLPGIPVAIADRTLQLVSVDSVGKKINFQKHIKRILHLNNMQAENVRVEALGSQGIAAEKFDVVVSRAFSSLETILNLTADLVAPGGRIIAMRGPEALDEIGQVEALLEVHRLSEPEIYHYQLPFTKAERNIIIIHKK